MNAVQQKTLQSLYRKHFSALRRRGKADRTIDSYAPAGRTAGDRILVHLSGYSALGSARNAFLTLGRYPPLVHRRGGS
ncbi:hypothetical protein IMCC21906_03030 [Spongiibacter sp. IMCC21906]|jgi:hypothetical protein|nr:hypothetical protein IMCC21906_03030 [Spongiibacter sp. IMCC21906]